MRLSLLAFCVLLTACEPPASSGSASGAAQAGSLPDTAMVREVTLAGTADLAGGDLTTASPSVAIQTLDLWIARLDTVSVDGAPEVRSDLTRLRNLLQSSPLDGAAIGRTLRELGASTAAIDTASADLARLAQALQTTGRRLAPDTTGVGTGQPEP